MRSRIFWIPVFIVLVCFLVHFTSGGFDAQGPRLFENPCDGCVVSKGIGFQSFPDDCTCFYTCVLVMSPKLSSMASPYVAYKKCCGCGESFSKKLLTCVNCYDKRSDCFDENSIAENPCLGANEGDRFRRAKATGIDDFFCSGFIECKNVSGTVVPDPFCCPEGDCFDTGPGMCTEAACDDTPECEALPEGEEDDCECESTEAPESECQYMAMENSNVKFMHIQEMRSYDCPPGTCWDQELCTCVTANNTGYNDCEEYVDMDFDTDLNATDSRGAVLYTTVHGNVTRDNDMALFPGVGGAQLNVVGTSNSWLSNDLVLHFRFTLLEDNESSDDETQCIVGNCKEVVRSTPRERDTLYVNVVRGEDGSGEEILVHVEYQDKIFMNIPNSMEEVDLNLEGPFDIDSMYDFWLIYCGSEEVVYAGVLFEGDAISAAEGGVPGSVQILDSQSGFVFGDCEQGHDFEGALDEVEIYKNCKPIDDNDFDEAFDEILELIAIR